MLTVDPAGDRAREIVVPDFRFLDLLVSRLRAGEDRLIFELLLGTGGRRSEVADMRIGDVDLTAGRVWVREPVVEVDGRQVRNSRPKGGRIRAVIVGPQLAELLRQHLASLGASGPDAPLFSGARGGGLRGNNYFPRRMRPAIESASGEAAAFDAASFATYGCRPLMGGRGERHRGAAHPRSR